MWLMDLDSRLAIARAGRCRDEGFSSNRPLAMSRISPDR